MLPVKQHIAQASCGSMSEPAVYLNEAVACAKNPQYINTLTNSSRALNPMQNAPKQPVDILPDPIQRQGQATTHSPLKT